MPAIKVNSSEIYFAHGGQGQPALLFVHGSGADHTLWGEQFGQLKQDFTVTAIDLNGHGRSPAREGDGLQTHVEDVLNVLDALAMPTVLIGHSLGGAVALSVALKQAENLAGLILVGAGAKLRVHPQILELCRTNFEGAIDFVLNWAFAENPSPVVLQRAREQMRRNGQAALYRDFSSCNAFDVMSCLGEIWVPTLVICGQEDKLTPLKYSEYLKANIPNAQLTVIERAGHMVMLEQPDALSQTLREFCLQLR